MVCVYGMLFYVRMLIVLIAQLYSVLASVSSYVSSFLEQSCSMETAPSASPDVNEYVPNVVHPEACIKNKSQRVGAKRLQYGKNLWSTVAL